MDYQSVRRIALTAARAFCTAFCARSALKLLNRLLSGRMHMRLEDPARVLKAELASLAPPSIHGLHGSSSLGRQAVCFLCFSSSDVLRSLSKDCVRMATFLAAYSAAYRIIVRVLETVRKVQDGCNAATAAALAGISLSLADRSDRQSIALFALTRGLGSLYNTLRKRGYPVQLPFGSIILYSICHWVICSALLLKPHLLPSSYYKALLKYSESFDDQTATVMFRQPSFVPCDEILHQGMSCWQCMARTGKRVFIRFITFYTVLYGLSLMMTPRKILRRPLARLASLAYNVLISASFFTTEATVFIGSLCVLRKAAGQSPLPVSIATICSTLASLSLLIERPTRRPELTMFMLHHAVVVAVNWLKEKKVVNQGTGLLKRLSEVVVFSASMMPIMHAYERERESNSSLVNILLSFIV